MIMLTQAQVEALAAAIDMAQQWVDECEAVIVLTQAQVEALAVVTNADEVLRIAREALGLVVKEQRDGRAQEAV